MKIGILALQGGFTEHEIALKKLNINTVLIRCNKDLLDLDGIILPGGESTAIGFLLQRDLQLFQGLKEFILKHVVWGTCAGLILLSEQLDQDKDQARLGGLPIIVKRNGYGRQLDSFVKSLDLELGTEGIKGFPGVFIRAPKIVLQNDSLSSDLKVIARLNGDVVGIIRDNRIIGTSFHPELTSDLRFHKYFIDLVKERMQKNV